MAPHPCVAEIQVRRDGERITHRQPRSASQNAFKRHRFGSQDVQRPEILHRAVAATAAQAAAAEMKLLAPYVNASGRFDRAKVARGIALVQSMSLTPSITAATRRRVAPHNQEGEPN